MESVLAVLCSHLLWMLSIQSLEQVGKRLHMNSHMLLHSFQQTNHRCYRIMSLICFVIGLSACWLLGAKDKDKKQAKTSLNIKETFDFSVANDWRYILWCIIDILFEAAYNTPAYFLPCKSNPFI